MSSGANFKFLAEKMDLDKVSVVSWDYPAQGLATGNTVKRGCA
jgi:hypothetical protein